MTAVAFITTSKGRLHHIRQTLPLIVAQSPAEIMVVDYACPQQTGDWVEAHYGPVKGLRVSDDPGFCVSSARNIGALETSSPWLLFIDADVEVAPGLVDWVRKFAAPNSYYVPVPSVGQRADRELDGTVLVERKAFERIGGRHRPSSC